MIRRRAIFRAGTLYGARHRPAARLAPASLDGSARSGIYQTRVNTGTITPRAGKLIQRACSDLPTDFRAFFHKFLGFL